MKNVRGGGSRIDNSCSNECAHFARRYINNGHNSIRLDAINEQMRIFVHLVLHNVAVLVNSDSERMHARLRYFPINRCNSNEIFLIDAPAKHRHKRTVLAGSNLDDGRQNVDAAGPR